MVLSMYFSILSIYRQLEKSIDTSSLNFELQRERERVLLYKKRVGVRNVSSRLTFKLTSSQIFLGVQYIPILQAEDLPKMHKTIIFVVLLPFMISIDSSYGCLSLWKGDRIGPGSLENFEFGKHSYLFFCMM